MDKNYKMPSVVWLKMTDYMHGWLQYELGGDLRVKDQQVLSVQHIPGAREVLRMETVDDMMNQKPVGNSMSSVRRNCIELGLRLDIAVVEQMYGVTKESLKLFVPIECPRMCLTRSGVLRPWTLNVCLGRQQATALQRLLRNEFWKAVEFYNQEYAEKMEGRKYPAVNMIEDFCIETGTLDIYVEAIRREWQRRVKRAKEKEV